MSEANFSDEIARRHGGLIEYLEPLLDRRHSTLDPAQVTAMERLQRLAGELEAFRAARQSRLKRIFAAPPVPRGIYLWGGVGRGKSLLMDSFYATVGIRRKRRIHFHAFMRETQDALAAIRDEADPLATVAIRIARRYRLICFDEFHVSDIADAMILGRLMEGLCAAGVVLVLTSNYPPDGLWPDGLLRERFLPAIDTIKRCLDVVEVDVGIDYRLQALGRVETWYVPAGAESERSLDRVFESMRAGPDEETRLVVDGRALPARRRAGSIVWFDFAALCDGPRSQRDYLELARRFAVVLISSIPQLGPATPDQARRFTWLIDILYDHRVKLVASAAVPPESLYADGPNARGFPRTVSRLVEMRTRDYMAQPHTCDGEPGRDSA
ncbi:MAG: cell division protein ZapE [Casimicrobiaceae bacterium]